MNFLKRIKNKVSYCLFIFREWQINILSQKKFKKNFSLKNQQKLIKLIFKNKLGYKLNLKNPQTFNEKIQWLKFNYHSPLLTKCADKYLVRSYIAENIGEKHLIPILGAYSSVKDIDFKSLPKKFVIKTNWGSGQNIIINNKKEANLSEIKKKIRHWLKPESNHFYFSFEWSYKNIKPKIVCEKYLEQGNKDLYDYKLMVFNGVVKYFIICYNRKKEVRYENYYSNGEYFIASPENPKKPKKNLFNQQDIDKMKKIAEKLAQPFPFVRIDFYLINKKIYVGEMTFYPEAGWNNYYRQRDLEFGKMLKL